MGKTYKQFFLNFNALKTHFILNTYALVSHGIKFYQFQSLSNLHFYKILKLEEVTLRFKHKFSQCQGTRSSYHYPHIKTEAKQTS